MAITMSKKRYVEMKERLTQAFPTQDTDKVLQIICDIMKFDPDIGLYSKERLEKLAEHRKKIMNETGKSLYEVSGAKKYYETHKKRIT